jgi:hypothetical protein
MDGFNEWLSATAFSQAIQTHFWAIPTLQIVHIVCLAVLFASALMLTLRVLGKAWREQPAGDIAARFTPPIWVCLVILLITGAMLISAEPGRTLTNYSFYLKMSMLVVAIALTLTVSSAARRSTLGGAHRGMAVISMLLWAGIIVAGRYIAYT